MKYSSILAEQKPALYTRDEDTNGSLFWEETRCDSFQDLWIIGLLQCDQICSKKLDPIVELEILVGHANTPHNYQAFLPTSQRKMVRIDLKFNEQKSM